MQGGRQEDEDRDLKQLVPSSVITREELVNSCAVQEISQLTLYTG